MTQELKINNLYEYIDLIRPRVAMYVGESTLSALYFHIKGYEMACHLKGIIEELKPNFYLFNDFVADYYLYGESTAGWKNIILAQTFGDEKLGLEKFYKLIDLFRQDLETTNAKQVLFKILENLILKQINFTKLRQEDLLSISTKLSDLPNRLGRVRFSHEYNDILKDLKEFAASDNHFQTILKEMNCEIN